jgi:hypothetical protein
MLVQYHDRYDVVAEFNPESGQIRPLPRPAELGPTGTDGWFAILAGTCVVFYRDTGRLWLRVGDRTFDVDANASVDWRIEEGNAVFSVADDVGQVVVKYPSGPLSGPSLCDDPTPFVEEEDWDLGQFVTNILNDEERSDLLRRTAS